jgi:hypothetical protein
LSAVRPAQLQAQFEAQLDMFRTFTTRALDSAGQLAALNVRASRDSLEQAAGAFRHLLDAREPRDLFALGSAAQGQWQTLFSYGRELFGLAAGVRTLPAQLPAPMQLLAAPAPTANVPTTYTQFVDQASIATADVTTITSEIAAAAVDTGAALAEAAIDAGTRSVTQAETAQASAAVSEAAAAPTQDDAQLAAFEAAIESAIADDVPPAEPTALAKALSEVAPKPAGIEHPLAATVALQGDGQLELPPVAPTDKVASLPKASRGPRRK